jgi:hypothetical protein
MTVDGTAVDPGGYSRGEDVVVPLPSGVVRTVISS